jgi:hypothetical protein
MQVEFEGTIVFADFSGLNRRILTEGESSVQLTSSKLARFT